MATTLPTWDETVDVPSWDDTKPAEEAGAEQPTVETPSQRPLAPTVLEPIAPVKLETGKPLPETATEQPIETAIKQANPIGQAWSLANYDLTQLLPKPVKDAVISTAASDILKAIPTETTKGVSDALENLNQGIMTPLGIATLGLGFLPKIAQRAVSLAFAGQMASQVPKIAKELGDEFGKPSEQRDARKIATLLTEGAGTVGLSAMLSAHGLSPTEQIKPTEVQNARSQPSTERISSPQVRAGMDEEASLRQQGEIAEVSPQITGRPGEAPSPAGNEVKPESLTPALVIKEKAVPAKDHIEAMRSVPESESQAAVEAFAEEGDVNHVFLDENGNRLNRIEAAKKYDKMVGNKEGTTKELFSHNLTENEKLGYDPNTHAFTIKPVEAKPGSTVPLSESKINKPLQQNERIPTNPTERANEPELQTPEDFMAGEIQRLAINPLGDVDSRSMGSFGFDITEWDRASRENAQSIPDTFVYSPTGTDKVIIEFPKGKRPSEAIRELVDAEKGQGMGESWFPISHVESVRGALRNGFPVSALAVETYKLSVPKGYVKEGGIYRRMDSQAKGVGPSPNKPKAGLTPTPPPAPEKKAVAPVEPELVGMGAAKAGELQANPQSPTAMKYRLIDQERQQRGLEPLTKPETTTDQGQMDKAMAKLDQDPQFADRLISDINSGKKKVIEDWENHVLLLRKIDLKNEYAKSAREAIQAYEDGRIEDMNYANARTQEWSNALEQVEKASRISGSARGRALRSLRVMANEDFSLASLEMQKRAARGGKPITILERAELQKIADEYKSKSDALEKRLAERDNEDAAKAVQEALDKIAREAKPVIQYHPKVLEAAERIVVGFEKRATAASARLREKLNRLNVGADPTIVMDIAEIGMAKLARASLDLAKWSDLMIKEYGPKIEPFLKQGYEAAKKLLEKDLTKVNAPIKKRIKESISESEKNSTELEKLKVRVQKRLTDEKDIVSPIQAVARILYKTGITDREKMVDALHEFMLTIKPDITRSETAKAFAGYGDFKQLSKDEITVGLRGMKGELQQLLKLEDMAKGQPPLKSGVERRTPTEAERQLIKKVNEAKFAFQVPMTDPATQLKSALDTYKTNLKNRISDYEDRLKRGDFTRKPRRELQLDKAALDLRHQMEVIRRKFHEELLKDKLANQDIFQRAGRFVGEFINTVRALKASVDLSATLRQGGIIVAGHPIRGAKSIPDQLKAFASPKEAFRVEQEILARPNYRLYERDGLSLTEHGQKLSQMEEAYMSRWAEHIPGVAGSQRAYTVFLNKLRADSFDAMAKWVTRDGKKELTPDEGKIIANYINVATGRGNIGLRENALVGLNTAFFAPRLVASRFQYLFGQPLYHGIFSGKTSLKGTLRARALIAGEYARFIAAAGTIYTLAYLAGNNVESDPRSSDFGKIKVGKTRVDPMAGLIQTSVLTSRLASGETKTMRGAVVPIRGPKVPFGTGNSADVIARFLRTKLSPVFGTSVDVLSGKNVVGQPVTTMGTLQNLTVPLSIGDIYQAMLSEGVPAGSALALLSVFGVGIQTQTQNKPIVQAVEPINIFKQ